MFVAVYQHASRALYNRNAIRLFSVFEWAIFHPVKVFGMLAIN